MKYENFFISSLFLTLTIANVKVFHIDFCL